MRYSGCLASESCMFMFGAVYGVSGGILNCLCDEIKANLLVVLQYYLYLDDAERNNGSN